MPDRLVAALLQEWRDAERQLDGMPPDAPAEFRATVQRHVDSVRTAYQEATRALDVVQRQQGTDWRRGGASSTGRTLS